MRTWQWITPRWNTPDDFEPIEVIITDEQILNEMYDDWSKRLYKMGRILLATEENCIEDYVIVNWAVEVKI